jgi:ABC-type nitrate/sulfonate/bicarbonate transport system ATPase subunit
MADEPTIGEAMRRLDAVSKQMETLARQLAEDRRDFASTYVRHDLYEARHLSLDRRVTIVENNEEERERDEAEKRRQFTFIVLGVALTSVAGLLMGLVNLALSGR